MKGRLVLSKDIDSGLRGHPRVNAYVRRVVEAGAAGARRRAPVDTGRLRDSIRTEYGEGTGRWFTDVPYAVHQEYGTWKMRAHPFMRPSVNDAIREALRVR